MTFPSLIRVFFAIDLPLSTKKNLGQFISELKKNSKTNAIRWTKPENLHITLHFLARVRREDLEMLIENVRNKAEKSLAKTFMSFGSLHLFPNPYRPRVIVLEIQPQDQLSYLAEQIGIGIQNTNYEIDQRPFRAHLTLGRIKYTKKINLNFLNNFQIPEFEKISISEVVLFRSEPQPEGSKYTILETINIIYEGD